MYICLVSSVSLTLRVILEVSSTVDHLTITLESWEIIQLEKCSLNKHDDLSPESRNLANVLMYN